MRSDDLTREQARALKAKLRPMLGYVCRWQKRMHKRRFPRDDNLIQLVGQAYESMHALNIEVHYLSCSGVGRAGSDGGDDSGPSGMSDTEPPSSKCVAKEDT